MADEQDIYQYLMEDSQRQINQLQKYFNQQEQDPIQPISSINEQANKEDQKEKLFDQKTHYENLFLEIQVDIQKMKEQLEKSEQNYHISIKNTAIYENKIKEKLEFLEIIQDKLDEQSKYSK